MRKIIPSATVWWDTANGVGDPPPEGYNDWHEWAKVQHNGGLRQHRCPTCRKWQFPQEKNCC